MLAGAWQEAGRGRSPLLRTHQADRLFLAARLPKDWLVQAGSPPGRLDEGKESHKPGDCQVLPVIREAGKAAVAVACAALTTRVASVSAGM
jgi:hypothetical protein